MKSFKLFSAVLALSCALQVSQCLGSDLVSICEPLNKSEQEDLVGVCKPLTHSEQKVLNPSEQETCNPSLAGLVTAMVVLTAVGLILECKDYFDRPRQTKAMEAYWDVTNRYNAAMREDAKRRETSARP